MNFNGFPYMPKKKRLGMFRITPELLEEMKRDDLKQFFANMIIYQAQMNYRTRTIDYVAESDLFEPVEEYCCAPEYEMICRRESSGVIIVEAKQKRVVLEECAAPLRTSFQQKILNLKNAINALLP
jgi:hypothetical protein